MQTLCDMKAEAQLLRILCVKYWEGDVRSHDLCEKDLFKDMSFQLAYENNIEENE